MRWKMTLAVLLIVIVTACTKSPSGGHSSSSMEECDPGNYIPCIQQNLVLSAPIADTNLFLTYSSLWVSGASGHGLWNAHDLGLGGWSFNVVQHYEAAKRLLIGGDGSWRTVDSIPLGSGEQVVPSYDGSMAYVFDSSGRHVRTVDGHMGTEFIRLNYDSSGRLSKIDGYWNGSPVHVSVGRDAQGTAHSLIGIDDGITSLNLDSHEHLTSISDPARQTTQIAWNAAGQVEEYTDPAGGASRFTYDESGKLSTLTDADGVEQHFERKQSSGGIEIAVCTKLGRCWSYRSESVKDGVRRTYVAPNGSTTTETVDAHDARLIKTADGTSISVGALANPVWGMASPIQTPVISTRTDGVVSRSEIKSALQPQGGVPYILVGSVRTRVNGQDWVNTFDSSKRSLTSVDPAGRSTSLFYDEGGRLLSRIAPHVPPTTYSYDKTGRISKETVGTGPLARSTLFAYDSERGEITITRPDGSTEKTSFDKAGNAVSKTAGDGSMVLASYDAAGQLTRVQPAGGLNYTIGRSPAGRSTAFAPPMAADDASVETSSYDDDGQLIAIAGLGKDVNFAYDSAGRVTSWKFDQGKRQVSYDSHSGLPNESIDPAGVHVTYGYSGDVPNRLEWSGAVQGSVADMLDANRRTVSEAVNGAGAMTFGYDGVGDLTSVGGLSLTRDGQTGLVTQTRLGVVETTHMFDSNYQLIRCTTTANGSVVLDQLYTRDVLGRIKAVAATSASKVTKTEYFYDRAASLESVRINGAMVEANSYDPAGNRIEIQRPPEKLAAHYDDRQRALNVGSTKYAWAANGNLARREDPRGKAAFYYDDFGALRKVTLVDGRQIDYLVDADGRRVGRKVGGKLVAEYLYRIDGLIAAELDGSGKLVSRFGYDEVGHPALVERQGVTYRIITDAVGSPLVIIDSNNGAIVDQTVYDAWGNITFQKAPGFIPLGFAGGLRDSDSGLVLFGARDYDPQTGRWTAPDPIRFNSGEANLYRYAGGDPVNQADPSGLFVPGAYGVVPIVIGVGAYYGAYKYISAPPQDGSDGNQPQNNSSPQGSNPPHTGSPSGFKCVGLSCNGPGRGSDTQACFFGGCSNGPRGFICAAAICIPPGDWSGTCFFCTFGEPHLQISDKLNFDFQAVGEFISATSPDGKLLVQVRQEKIRKELPVTFNSAIAVSVNGDRVAVYSKEPWFLEINGKPVEQGDLERRLPRGGTIHRHGGFVSVGWPDGTRLDIVRFAFTLNANFLPSPELSATTHGLLGGAGVDSLTVIGRDGTALSRSDPAFQDKIYHQFGDSWRIRQSESLFHYWPGESTARFTDVNFPSKIVTAASLDSKTRSSAETVCRSLGVRTAPVLDDCILDVGLTGMPALGAPSAAMSSAPLSLGAPGSVSTPAASALVQAPLPDRRLFDQFAIKIGDTVSADHPGKGAGKITHSGQRQSYSFSGEAGGSVYLAVGPCDGDKLTFEIRKPDGNLLDMQVGCHDLGPLVLDKTGTYQVIAHSESGMANYAFTLRGAIRNHFAISIGDAISPNQPEGAGRMTEAGQRQVYSFTARQGQIVYLGIGPCAGASLVFDLKTPQNNLLDKQIGCHDLGREVLPSDGAYTIAVSGDKNGSYSFLLHPVVPDRHFAGELPATVSPDIPKRGAGHMTSQGEQHFYDFTASAGTTLHIESKCYCANLMVRATRAGDASRFGFQELNRLSDDWTLPSGGRYTLQLRSDGFTGDYSFSVSQKTAHTH